MPSLSSIGPMQSYAGEMIAMYDNWSTTPESQRRSRFETLIRQLADRANLPAPLIVWSDDGGAFYYTTWTLEVDRRAASVNPRVGNGEQKTPLKDWLYYSTSIYHEMRHCEQYFMIAQALLSNKFPLPLMGSRAVLPGGDQPSQLAAWLDYPIMVARRAHVARSAFDVSDLPRTRAWCDSMFGSSNRIRQQTMAHLDRRGRHINKYIELAEEADAWAVERQLSRLIRDRINQRDGGEALAGLAAMFA